MNTKDDKNSLLSYETLIRALSGAAGSVTAMSLFYPLDTVRLRLQVDDVLKSKSTIDAVGEIINCEGHGSLYKGLIPVLQSLCASNFVYFYSYHGLRKLYYADSTKRSPLIDLAIGAVSGIVNVLTTTPLWVVNTKMKMQSSRSTCNVRCPNQNNDAFKGILDGLMKVAQKEGVSGLWSGTTLSLLLVINPAIQFTIYELLKGTLKRRFGRDVNTLEIFLIGSVAKMVSTCVTYPLQVFQSKLRYRGKNDEIDLMKFAFNIVRTRGLRGLYKGLDAKLYQSVLTTAFMFMFYEKIFNFVFRLSKNLRD